MHIYIYICKCLPWSYSQQEWKIQQAPDQPNNDNILVVTGIMEGGSSHKTLSKKNLCRVLPNTHKRARKKSFISPCSVESGIFVQGRDKCTSTNIILYIYFIGRETTQVHSPVSHNTLDLDNISHQYDYKYVCIYINIYTHVLLFRALFVAYQKNTQPKTHPSLQMSMFEPTTHNPQTTAWGKLGLSVLSSRFPSSSGNTP